MGFVLAGNLFQGLFIVIRYQGAGSFDGKKLVFDGITAGRENVHPVEVPMVNFLTNHFQNRFKIDISDQVTISVNGLPDSLSCDGIYFETFLIDEIFSFQKYDFKDGALVFKNMMVKIDVGKHFDHPCFRQPVGKFTKVFLIGESI